MADVIASDFGYTTRTAGTRSHRYISNETES